MCEHHLLVVQKMLKICNAKNIYQLVVRSLKEIARMDNYKFVTKVICVGADGVAMMQGYKIGLYVRLQTFIIPYMITIH